VLGKAGVQSREHRMHARETRSGWVQNTCGREGPWEQ
jgi:hypothetical protein